MLDLTPISPLAGGVVLQVDQATPSHQGLYGTSDNAVKTQIWIAISIYVLVAIVKKRLNLDYSLYSILQILSVTILEKTPILQVLSQLDESEKTPADNNQLILFN